MAVALPKGVVKLPWSLTRDSTGITLTDSVANVETEIVAFQIPRNMSVAVSPGNRLFVDLATAAEATIEKGTVRVYVADANKATKFKIVEVPIKALNAGATGTRTDPLISLGDPSDREKMHKLSSGFSRNSDEFILVTFQGADVAEADDTILILDGLQFIKI